MSTQTLARATKDQKEKLLCVWFDRPVCAVLFFRLLCFSARLEIDISVGRLKEFSRFYWSDLKSKIGRYEKAQDA